jgi:hypothetical protein
MGVLVLVQEPGSGSTDCVFAPESEELRFADLVDPPREHFFGVAQITRSSAFANSLSSDPLVDVPVLTALDEPSCLRLSHCLLLC